VRPTPANLGFASSGFGGAGRVREGAESSLFGAVLLGCVTALLGGFTNRAGPWNGFGPFDFSTSFGLGGRIACPSMKIGRAHV
jgi:hypothetical protein